MNEYCHDLWNPVTMGLKALLESLREYLGLVLECDDYVISE
jgi:hypothetical protein